MDDRLSSLIERVQSKNPMRDDFPLGVQPRWPAAEALLENSPTEVVSPGLLHDEPQWLEGQEKISHAGDADQQGPWLDFPEHVDGMDVLLDIGPPKVDSVDALAFYLPFHFFQRWGVYIRESGVLKLASEVFENLYPTPFSPRIALNYAYEILLYHELFHHLVEVAAARVDEIRSSARPTYKDFFNDTAAAEIEEALANAFALHRADVSHPMKPRMRRYTARWMRTLAPGYRDFHKFRGREFAPGQDALFDRIACLQGTSSQPPLVAGRLFFRDVDLAAVPVHVVLDHGGLVGVARPLSPWGPLKVWTHSNDHRPPHVHASDQYGKGSGSGFRFEWPGRRNMDDAPKKLERMFASYADRFSGEIDVAVARIPWN